MAFFYQGFIWKLSICEKLLCNGFFHFFLASRTWQADVKLPIVTDFFGVQIYVPKIGFLEHGMFGSCFQLIIHLAFSSLWNLNSLKLTKLELLRAFVYFKSAFQPRCTDFSQMFDRPFRNRFRRKISLVSASLIVTMLLMCFNILDILSFYWQIF